jgi:hypothetical protein
MHCTLTKSFILQAAVAAIRNLRAGGIREVYPVQHINQDFPYITFVRMGNLSDEVCAALTASIRAKTGDQDALVENVRKLGEGAQPPVHSRTTRHPLRRQRNIIVVSTDTSVEVYCLYPELYLRYSYSVSVNPAWLEWNPEQMSSVTNALAVKKLFPSWDNLAGTANPPREELHSKVLVFRIANMLQTCINALHASILKRWLTAPQPSYAQTQNNASPFKRSQYNSRCPNRVKINATRLSPQNENPSKFSSLLSPQPNGASKAKYFSSPKAILGPLHDDPAELELGNTYVLLEPSECSSSR